MTRTLHQSHPEASAALSLWAIFRLCDTNRAEQEQARQAREGQRLAHRRFWWQDQEDRDNIQAYDDN